MLSSSLNLIIVCRAAIKRPELKPFLGATLKRVDRLKPVQKVLPIGDYTHVGSGEFIDPRAIFISSDGTIFVILLYGGV
jgi:hypothetical protein